MPSFRLLLSVLSCLLPSNHAWSGPKQQLTSRLSTTAQSRREAFATLLTSAALIVSAPRVLAEDTPSPLSEVEVVVNSAAKSIFNEGRAYEMQGNMAAAQRLYQKTTVISPRFIYGWSNLGNTQVALGALNPADESYTKAIALCKENLKETESAAFGVRRCDDLYLLYLNRGCLRLNNGQPKEALSDLQQASSLRGRPDGVIAQNLARAKELNGMFRQADNDYNMAISMTSSEVSPFWLRSALVKFELGDVKGGFDLLKRVENRFPEAPEVRAAYATFLAASGDQIAAQRKYLEIPNRARLKYVDENYLKNVVLWPPSMIEGIAKVASAVGDKPPQ